MKPIPMLIAGSLLVTCVVVTHAGIVQSQNEEKERPASASPVSFVPEKLRFGNDSEYQKAFVEFQRRTIVGAYQKYRDCDPKFDKDAVEFLEKFVRYQYEDDHTSTRRMVDLGQGLIKAGCRDPMVTSSLGIILDDPHEGALALLHTAAEEFKNSRYPKWRARCIPFYIYQMSTSPDGGHPASKQYKDEVQNEILDLTAEALRDGGIKHSDIRFAIHSFSPVPTDLFQLTWLDGGPLQWGSVYDRIKDDQRVDPYMKDICGGYAQMDLVFGRPGDGRGIDEFDLIAVSKAVGFLMKAWKLDPEFPEAPSALFKLSMFGGTEEDSDIWFKRATDAQFDYGEAYKSYIEYLRGDTGRPDFEGLYNFGIKCLKSHRFDTIVPKQFLCAMQTMDSGSSFANKTISHEYWAKEKTAKLFDEMYEGYERSEYSHSRAYWTSCHAINDWYCGNFPEARKILEKMGQNYDRWAFEESKTAYNKMREESFLFSESHWQALWSAKQMQEAGNNSAAIAVYRRVLKTMRDPEVAAIIEGRISSMETVKGFSNGRWMSVMPSKGLSGWSIVDGDWSVGQDGSLSVKNKCGMSRLIYDTPLGRRLEFQGEVVFPGKSSQCVILMGVPEKHPDWVAHYTGVMLSPGRKNVAIGRQGCCDNRLVVPDLEYGPDVKFTIRLWDDQVTVVIGDKVVVKSYKTGLGYTGRYIGVGANGCCRSAEFELKNLKVRKLTSNPDL